jgi:hypothetical protein
MNTVLQAREGVEGPCHDPYAFNEIIVSNGLLQIKLHDGLGEWLEVKWRGSNDVILVDEEPDTLFAKLTGYTPDQCLRFLRKRDAARYRMHRACGGTHDVAGYPGETFTMCKCGAVIDHHLSLGAII